MPEPVAPIGSQFSALAARAPDAPAVTCGGRTVTRAELESSTNRLARAYAEHGVGVGDYVTVMLPNSIEWVQAVVATWKLGAIPQPLSPRLPQAEIEGLLDLHPRALLVGRSDARGAIASVAPGFTPDPALSCPTRCRRRGSRWHPAAAPGAPNSSKPAATAVSQQRRSARGWVFARATLTWCPSR
jgi:bile acid-coenzyme A ligase